jgi:ABC-type transport system involved in multi-copper enzyme maturation permease subunit
MTTMRALLTITRLTVHEAARRRILLATFICGVAFIVLFGIGFHFIEADIRKQSVSLIQRRMLLNFFMLAGLYAINFLTVMTAVLLPVDTLSGEIASGVMQTLASKPIRRSEIVLGKWLAYVLIVIGYLVAMTGGVLGVGYALSGVVPPRVTIGIPLMALEATLLTTLSILGGTRFATVTNGVVVFGLYGLAFIGSWVEQIGAHANNIAARNVGTVASLIMPSESMWQLAAHHMQPPLMADLHLTPFSPASVPSSAMVLWAVGYTLVALVAALQGFRRRPL